MLRLYAVLCVVGGAVPLIFLGSFVADEGVDVRAFYDQMTATDIGLFAWSDVAVSAVVVIALAVRERSRGLSTWWLSVVATVTVGVSLGLPLLLLLRERASRTARA
jgi:Terpene cyclase DEP1